MKLTGPFASGNQLSLLKPPLADLLMQASGSLFWPLLKISSLFCIRGADWHQPPLLIPRLCHVHFEMLTQHVRGNGPKDSGMVGVEKQVWEMSAQR